MTSPHKNRAFTLIELLVVVSVVALLCALILPSLAQARETSYKILCQSNLRQSGIAVSNYAVSYKNHIPGNAHNADASDNRGPLKQVLDITVRQYESTNALRTDRNYDDLYSYSGMGLLMATDFIPYT